MCESWMSSDGGLSWELAAGSENLSIQMIVALDNGIIWAAFEDAVYKSIDNGASFVRAFPSANELPTVLGEAEIEYVTSIAFKPDDTDEIFAGTARVFDVFFNRGSVWRSTNGGADWTDITGGLTQKRINALTYRDGSLYIATGGADVFKKQISAGEGQGEGERARA